MKTHVLITGGAGFIGINAADRVLELGQSLTILDNLSRPGCDSRLEWLGRKHGQDSFRLVAANVEDLDAVRGASADADVIYHLAGQVAVTTSVADPLSDFRANALGTLNVLEAARLSGRDPIVLYSSTNKVYGGLETLEISEEPSRYTLPGFPFGIPETLPIRPETPYSCSKACGDQYCQDYYRIYGLRTVVLRQSCIYGPWQYGVEDQGWLAWFVLSADRNHPLTVFGDGKQVRDILYVTDLIDCYQKAVGEIDKTAGQAYNIGGGPGNTISVWRELRPLLEETTGRSPKVDFLPWRPRDQKVFVSDIRKAEAELDWLPAVGPRAGLRALHEWIAENVDLP